MTAHVISLQQQQAMMATIPAGVEPGGQFQLQTPAGAMLMVTCPADAVPGQQIHVMVDVPIGGVDPAAMAEFERLLMATSQITIRHKGGSQKPAVATLTLDMDGIREALSLVVNIDPESKTKKAGRMDYLRNMEPYLAFRTELKLVDGRSVVTLSHPGVTGLTYGRQNIEVQVMDRDGPVSISAEPIRPSIWDMCDPLSAEPKTRAVHPQSADETLRHGYEMTAPAALNHASTTFNTFVVLPLATLTCCSGPVCLMCCVAPPNLHYELGELHSGKVVDGVRYTVKKHTFCGAAAKRGLPDGDTIHFAGSTPLPARKDMVLMAAYRTSKAAVWPDEG
jgi:hypothetical protein